MSKFVTAAYVGFCTFAVLLVLLGMSAAINYRLFVILGSDSAFGVVCGPVFILSAKALFLFWKWAVYEPAFDRFVKPSFTS